MTDPLEQLNAPPQVLDSLRRLCKDLEAAAGNNLAGLVLYGGLARDRYVPGRSDINLVVLLNDASAPSLAAVAPALHAAWRAVRVEPLLLTPQEIEDTAVVFPTKLLDIKNYHVLLAGKDPFAQLEVPREHVRLRIEQELRNLELRLRRRFLAITGSSTELAETLGSSARPLALGLASLLAFLGKPVPGADRTTAILEAAARELGLDGAVLARLARLRQHPHPEGDEAALFGGVLSAIGKAIRTVAALKEAGS